MGHNQIEKNKKYNLFVDGERIYLREIRVSDVDKNYCNWMKDQEVIRFLESRFEKWSNHKLRNYVRKINKNRDYLFWAIIFKDSGKHIGNIKIGPINRTHKFADLGIIIGEKKFWGQGLATEAIKLVVDYCFDKLKLHKLTAGAYRNNIASIKAFKKAGFKIEGIRKEHCLYNGNYLDVVLLGIVNS